MGDVINHAYKTENKYKAVLGLSIIVWELLLRMIGSIVFFF